MPCRSESVLLLEEVSPLCNRISRSYQGLSKTKIIIQKLPAQFLALMCREVYKMQCRYPYNRCSRHGPAEIVVFGRSPRGTHPYLNLPYIILAYYFSLFLKVELYRYFKMYLGLIIMVNIC